MWDGTAFVIIRRVNKLQTTYLLTYIATARSSKFITHQAPDFK